MIFAFILVVAFIGMFIKLGMYSVWFTVLSTILKIMLLIIIGLFIPIIWRKLFRQRKKLIDFN